MWRKNHHSNSNNKKSALEPSGALPLIGHFLLLGGRVPIYRILGGLADEYGPVFGLRLGLHKILAKRPTSIAGIYLGYNYASFGFTDGPYWREMRKHSGGAPLPPKTGDVEACPGVKDRLRHQGIV
ncbi:cytochrome [Sesamum alatum]|uniref:Cytochrome n=1 Tax=Sesamum alatum TaxID=300844 RepID=A0AAE1Z3U1_9LAMI|nr:cytochrome [Sesamum alatum]